MTMASYSTKPVNEKHDYSREIFEISIESAIFNSMLNNLNAEIQRCIQNVYDERFESGEVTLKLTIELPEAFENFPIIDETGEATIQSLKYRKPVFEHKVTTTLKKQYKRDGGYTEKRDIQYRDGRYVAIPLKDPQLSIADL
jgi:hypothetical protein